MITDSFIKFGPGIACFSYGTGGSRVRFKDGTERPMTEQECQWLDYRLESDLEVLELLNAAEADAPLCERCNQFHPDLAKAPVMTMYADQEQPQPVLCPGCTEGWVADWSAMWDEYRSSQGV